MYCEPLASYLSALRAVYAARASLILPHEQLQHPPHP